MTDLRGQHALVTGGGTGLGAACARALAGAGAEVTILGRTRATLEETAGSDLRIAVADVTDPAAVAKAVAEADAHAPVSILVTAAGTNRPGPAVELAVDDLDRMLDANVRGTFLAAQAVGRRMLARGNGGRVILLSSQMGTVGYPGRAVYCATKHAVNGLAKALAVEWAPDGITVNAVAPTFVLTPLTAPMLADPAFAEDVLRRIPAGRLAELDHVTGAVLYLASGSAAMTTGQVLGVDGGWTAW